MKPKKVVDKNDPRTFSQPGAFEAIRKLAEGQVWTSGFGVAMTAAHFEPRLPNVVTAAEIWAAKDEIVARGLAQKGAKQAEAKKEASGGWERFPFDDEAQDLWERGRWKSLASGVYLTFSGLRGRFNAEITSGQAISKVQVDAYQAELEAKKADMDRLLDEKPDPNATGSELCEAPDGFHVGERKFQMTKRFKPEWTDGVPHRQCHKGGNEAIEVGNVLVVESDVPGDEPSVVIYCHACRQKVWKKIKEAKDNLPGLRNALYQATDEKEIARLKAEVAEAEAWSNIRANFYTLANADRKIGAIKKSAEGTTGALDQLKAASRKLTFGGAFGSRKAGGSHTWKTGPSRHRGQ